MPLAMSLSTPIYPDSEIVRDHDRKYESLYTIDSLTRPLTWDTDFERITYNTARSVLPTFVPYEEPEFDEWNDKLLRSIKWGLESLSYHDLDDEYFTDPAYKALIFELTDARLAEIAQLSMLTTAQMCGNIGPISTWSVLYNVPTPDQYHPDITQVFLEDGLFDYTRVHLAMRANNASSWYFDLQRPATLLESCHMSILDTKRAAWLEFLDRNSIPVGTFQGPDNPVAKLVLEEPEKVERKGFLKTSASFVSGMLNTPQKAEVLVDKINDLIDENTPSFTEKMVEVKDLINKMSGVMDVLTTDAVKESFETFKSSNTAVADFVKWVKAVLSGLQSPGAWLKYLLPIAAGIILYLIRSEKSNHLIPVLEGLALAGVAYVGTSHVGPLLNLCAHLRDGFFQGPLDTFNDLVSKMLSGYYNCSINFDRLSRILQHIPKDVDAITKIGNMITAFVSYVKVRIYLALGWDLKSGVTSVDNAVVKTRALVEELGSDSLPFTENTKMRVNELVYGIEHMMFDAVKDKDHIVVGLLRDCLAQLRKVQLAVVNRTGTGFGTRHEPVFVVLYGDTGQGKTTAMTYLEKALMREVFKDNESAFQDYCENTRNFVYNVGPGAKHWEGVGNNAKLIKVDELFAEKEAVGMEASQSLLLQRLINTAEFSPLMAFEKKGMISLEPDFVLATTNVTSLRGSHTLEVPNAMRRRLHILVKVTFDGEIDVKSVQMDLSKLRFHVSIVDKNLSFSETGEVLSLPELMAEIREFHKLFLDRQRTSHRETSIHTDYILAGDPDPTVYLENLRKSRLNYEKSQKTNFQREEGDDGEEGEIPIFAEDDDDPPRERTDSEPDGNGIHEFRKEVYHQYRLPQHRVWEFVQMLKPDDLVLMSKYGHLIVSRTSQDFVNFWELNEAYVPAKEGILNRLTGKDRKDKAFQVYLKFLHFCNITKFGWSLAKFMSFFSKEHYIPLMGAHLFDFCCYVERFSFGDTLDLFGGRALMKRCSILAKSLLGTVKTAMKSVLSDALQILKICAMTVFITVPILKLTFWVQKFFSKWVFQSDTQRKGHKNHHRNSRYNNRIREGNHDFWNEGTAEGDYGGGGFQVTTRVPEFLMNAQLGVNKNVYELTCPLFYGRMGYCLFLGRNDMLMPRHFWTAMEAASSEVPDESLHIIHFKQEGRDAITKTFSDLTKNCYSDQENEYFCCEVDLGRQHKDVSPHFADAAQINRFLVDFRNQFTVACTSGDMSWTGFPASYRPTIKLRHSDGEFAMVHNTLKIEGIDTKNGDCGMLYYAMDGPCAGTAVAMHIGGGSNGGMGFGMYLNRNVVERLRRELHERFEQPKIRKVLLDDISPPARVSSGNAHIEFEGNGRIVEYSKKNVNITTSRIEKRLENYKDFEFLAKQEHIDDVCDVIGARYLSQMQRIPKRLDYHTAVFGKPGEVVATNFSTSAGIPLTGTELDKRFWRHPDGSPNTKVLDQIRVYLNEAITDIMRGVWPNFVFKIFPKDETLPIEDVEEKQKVRTINGGPIIFILLQKMYFGDLCALIEHRPLEFNTLIGLDMNSMDGHSLVLRLLEVNPERDSLFGGDISKFEFRQRAEVAMAIFDRIIEPLYANASNEERVVRRNLWEMGVTTVNSFADKLYLVHGPRASGEYMTSLGNTIYVQVAVVYSYYKACDFIKTILPTFYVHVYCVSVGDDNIGSVSREVSSWFNQIAIRDGMKDLGLTYTDPNKGEITEPFMKLDEIVMLQCQPRYDVLMGRWIWYQKLQTVLEMAQWTKKIHKKPDMTIWASNVIDSLRKLCLHPKEVWDRYIPSYQKMIMGYGIEVPTWNYYGMQRIVFDEAYMGVRFKPEIEAEQADFQMGCWEDLALEEKRLEKAYHKRLEANLVPYERLTFSSSSSQLEKHLAQQHQTAERNMEKAVNRVTEIVEKIKAPIPEGNFQGCGYDCNKEGRRLLKQISDERREEVLDEWEQEIDHLDIMLTALSFAQTSEQAHIIANSFIETANDIVASDWTTGSVEYVEATNALFPTDRSPGRPALPEEVPEMAAVRRQLARYGLQFTGPRVTTREQFERIQTVGTRVLYAGLLIPSCLIVLGLFLLFKP
jgi:hypothetical protein